MIVLPLLLRSMGKILVTCSYDPPKQYQGDISAEGIAGQVIENVHPGMIVALHDGRDDNPEEFARLVEIIIVELRKRGYRFVAVDYSSSMFERSAAAVHRS